MASAFYRPRFRSSARWRTFRPVLERLEDRTAPAIGDLLQTFQDTPASGERFGNAVAGVGSNVLVGAPGVTVGGQEAAGAAYLLHGTTGAVLQTFTNPTPLAGEQFGFSVAAVGSNVLIGAPFATVGGHFAAGEAYLYDGNTGSLLKKFSLAGDPVADADFFGWAVGAVAGNVLVGAIGVTVDGHYGAGAAYQFDSTSFDLLKTYNNPDPGDSEFFGYAVSAGELRDDVLVGAPFADVGALQSAGSAYLINGTTGATIRTLTSPTPTAGNLFGKAVAYIGFSRLLVGEPNDDTDGNDAGAAYLFDQDGSLLNTFHAPTGGGGLFGQAIAGLNGNVLVGAPSASVGAAASGAAYMFDGHTAGLLQTFVNPDIDASDSFGWSVGTAGNNVLIGTPDESSAAAAAGKAYSFDFNALALAPRKDGVDDSIVIRLSFGNSIEINDGFRDISQSITSNVPLLVVGADGDKLTLRIGTLFPSFGLGLFTLPPGSEFRAGNGGTDELQVHGFDSFIRLGDSQLETLHAGYASLSGFEAATLGASAELSPNFTFVNVAFLASQFSGPLTLIGSEFGHDLLVGGPSADQISGGGGNDTVTAGGGDDILDGGDGDDLLLGEDGIDFLSGGSGNDTLVGGAGEDFVSSGLQAGQNTAILRNSSLTIPAFSTDVLSGIEVVELLGTAGSDFLDARGFSGRTFLRGFQGNDTLLGGNGNDALSGDLGNDSLNGGPGADRLSEGGTAGAVTLTLSNTRLTGTLGVDKIAGVESAFFNLPAATSAKFNAALFTLGSVTVFGSNGNDTLTGGTKNDLLDGSAGNDKLDGRQGNDSLTAGTGNDTVVGGAGLDRMIKEHTNSSGLSWVLTNTRLTVNGTVNNLDQLINSVDQLNGVEQTVLRSGGNGADSLNAAAFTLGPVTLDGGGGNDTLTGGSKNDLLLGGDGDDSLNGGNGVDIANGGNGFDTAINAEIGISIP